MLKIILPMAVVVFAAAEPASARSAITDYGPPSLKPAVVASPDPEVREALADKVEYRAPEGLLAANGVEITDDGARRVIASNMEFAVEPARGLVNEYGKTKKPMRLLLRVGAHF